MDFTDEDHEQTITEQLSLLAERIDNITEPVISQDPIKPVVNTNPKTTLEHKASALVEHLKTCLLYTSDAADEEDSVDLGGSRIIKKKKNKYEKNIKTDK